MKQNKLYIIILIVSILFTSCYTYNIPSGANTPLITKEKEFKVSANGNFNEIGGNLTYGLTNHVVFSSSGNYILHKDNYKQDYDSLFFKKTPNNFEVAFGYFGGKKKFANMFLFGVGAGNNSYKNKDNSFPLDGYYISQYYQTNYIQYFLQYTAGFKFIKQKYYRKKYRELGLSLRYAYHDYHVEGITMQHITTYEDGENGFVIQNEKDIPAKTYEQDFFNSFSVYYFYRTGNDIIQFEVSPGFSLYDKMPSYEVGNITFSKIHFNVGIVFNVNNLSSI